MMLTPCWPSAGPTGGAGVAAPALIWSLMTAVNRFLGGMTSFFVTGWNGPVAGPRLGFASGGDRKSTRLNSSHANISYAVFCLKKKNTHPSFHDKFHYLL